MKATAGGGLKGQICEEGRFSDSRLTLKTDDPRLSQFRGEGLCCKAVLWDDVADCQGSKAGFGGQATAITAKDVPAEGWDYCEKEWDCAERDPVPQERVHQQHVTVAYVGREGETDTACEEGN